MTTSPVGKERLPEPANKRADTRRWRLAAEVREALEGRDRLCARSIVARSRTSGKLTGRDDPRDS
jgi:hypothetical protein